MVPNRYLIASLFIAAMLLVLAVVLSASRTGMIGVGERMKTLLMEWDKK